MFRMEDLTAVTAEEGGDIIFEVDDGLNTLVDFRQEENMRPEMARKAENAAATALTERT